MRDHAATPVVLELRVHGVANTAPADILELPPAAVEQIDGDQLGSFWRPLAAGGRDRGDAGGRDRGDAGGRDRGDAGWVPPRVEREAYSWGGLARTTVVGGTGTVGTVVAALGRLGWTLLLPFGLTNVAYWSRVLTVPDANGEPLAEPAGHGLAGRPGQGAGLVRVFGLLLTLLLVTTACEVGIDLVGAQCYDGHVVRCTNLPSALDLVAGFDVGSRLALFSAVPVLLLLGLWQLTRISADRYEAATIGRGRHRRSETVPYGERPKTWLAAASFWDGRGAVGRLTAVHLAGGFALVALTTAWPALFGGGDACRTLGSLRTSACWSQVGSAAGARRWVFGVALLASVAVLVLAAVAVAALAGDSPDLASVPARRRRLPGVLLGAACVVLAGEVAALVGLPPVVTRPGVLDRPDPADRTPSFLPGVVTSPVVLTALLVGLGAAGLAVRAWRTSVCTTLGLALSALLLLPAVTPGAVHPWLLAAAVVVLAVLVLRPASAASRRARRDTVWAGRGPGVLMLLALAVAAGLSSIVVLTMGDWLNGGRGAAELLSLQDPLGGGPITNCTRGTTGQCVGPHLSVAAPYVWAGLVCVGFVVVFAICAVVLWVRRGGAPPAAQAFLGRAWRANFAGVAVRPGGQLTALRHLQEAAAGLTPSDGRQLTLLERNLLDQAATQRRSAAYAQRGERLAGLFCALATVAVVVAVALSTYGVAGRPSQVAALPAVVRTLLNGGVAVIALLGAAVVGSVAGGSATAGRRPLGLAWDLMCFLPRTGHPLGPPCYAERAVPEIVRRMEWWLDAEEASGTERPGAGRRHVVLSAHSLGAVLAVAAVCAASGREGGADTVRRVHLLTYGVQLRAYFGRLFPELLGPAVLGTNPVHAPRWTGEQPWRDEMALPPSAPASPSLRAMLDGRWRNLWRLTDLLGFPADSYRTGPRTVDRPAEEFDISTYVVAVDGHGDYQRTLVYLDELEKAVAASLSDPGPYPG